MELAIQGIRSFEKRYPGLISYLSLEEDIQFFIDKDNNYFSDCLVDRKSGIVYSESMLEIMKDKFSLLQNRNILESKGLFDGQKLIDYEMALEEINLQFEDEKAEIEQEYFYEAC